MFPSILSCLQMLQLNQKHKEDLELQLKRFHEVMNNFQTDFTQDILWCSTFFLRFSTYTVIRIGGPMHSEISYAWGYSVDLLNYFCTFHLCDLWDSSLGLPMPNSLWYFSEMQKIDHFSHLLSILLSNGDKPRGVLLLLIWNAMRVVFSFWTARLFCCKRQDHSTISDSRISLYGST